MIMLLVVYIKFNENKVVAGWTENNVELEYCFQYELLIILFSSLLKKIRKLKIIISEFYLYYNLVLKHSSTKNFIVHLMI